MIGLLLNFIKTNDQRGLFSEGYNIHSNTIECFLNKDSYTLNNYNIFIQKNQNINYPDVDFLIANIIDFINSNNMDRDQKHRQFCIYIWLHAFKYHQVNQLEVELSFSRLLL
jgi:hypothetical protein